MAMAVSRRKDKPLAAAQSPPMTAPATSPTASECPARLACLKPAIEPSWLRMSGTYDTTTTTGAQSAIAAGPSGRPSRSAAGSYWIAVASPTSAWPITGMANRA